MRIVPGGSSVDTAAVSSSKEVARTEASTGPVAAVTQSSATSLQSAVLQPAIAALNELPDVDEARVALLRDALAKGELPFDAGKLANLIESWHRSGK